MTYQPGDDHDPYFDNEVGVMRNLIGARTPQQLQQAEDDLVGHRLTQYAASPGRIRPSGDNDELRAIHHHLFQDVYAWAGHFRTVDLAKNVEGARHFISASRVETGLNYALTELRTNDLMLRSPKTPEQFVDRLAHHFDQLNFAHPFREGNGRTQRVFWARVARDAGWNLDWSRVTPKQNNVASAAAMSGDLTPLKNLLSDVVKKADDRPGRAFTPTHLSLGVVEARKAAARMYQASHRPRDERER